MARAALARPMHVAPTQTPAATPPPSDASSSLSRVSEGLLFFRANATMVGSFGTAFERAHAHP